MTDRDEALRALSDLDRAIGRSEGRKGLDNHEQRAADMQHAAEEAAEAMRALLASPRLPWVACEERLPEHKGELSIAHNEHRSSYCDAETWLRELEIEPQELARPDEIQRMIQADSIWHVQWYPDTPNGFYRRFAADLASALPTPEEKEK